MICNYDYCLSKKSGPYLNNVPHSKKWTRLIGHAVKILSFLYISFCGNIKSELLQLVKINIFNN